MPTPTPSTVPLPTAAGMTAVTNALATAITTAIARAISRAIARILLVAALPAVAFLAVAVLPIGGAMATADTDVPGTPPQAASGDAGTGRPGWHWPVEGRPVVLRPFAPPPAPWLAGHRGVDFAAEPGDRVLAAGDGIVGYAGPLAGRGVVTVLHANGLRTTYLPVRPSVRPGQTVHAGRPIGTLAAGAAHCPGTCLHWGLLRGPQYLDPLLLLRAPRLRLLPIW